MLRVVLNFVLPSHVAMYVSADCGYLPKITQWVCGSCVWHDRVVGVVQKAATQLTDGHACSPFSQLTNRHACFPLLQVVKVGKNIATINVELRDQCTSKLVAQVGQEHAEEKPARGTKWSGTVGSRLLHCLLHSLGLGLLSQVQRFHAIYAAPRKHSLKSGWIVLCG
jgi:hypothetical protein